MKGRNGLTSFLGRRWAVVFLVIEVVFFSFLGAGFFSLNGVQIVLFYGTTLFLLATAETFVVVTGGVDLSVGYIMGFSSVVSTMLAASFSSSGMAPGPTVLFAILATMAIGLLPGLLSGILVGYLRVPPFLATFSTGWIFYGTALLMSGGNAAKGVPDLANVIGNGYFMYWVRGRGLSFFTRPEVARGTVVIEIIPTMVVVTAAFVIVGAFLLKRTRFGRHAYAIGGNVDAAVRAGIDVKKHLLIVYTLSTFFAAFAGVIYMLEYVTGKSNAGAPFLLDAIVCVVIGGASLYGGIGTVWGSALGVIILQVLETGLRMMGVPTSEKSIAVGVILIMAVLIDQFFPELIHKED